MKFKKLIISIFVILLIVIIANQLYLTNQNLKITQLNGAIYSSEKLNQKTNLFVYLSTDCGLCKTTLHFVNENNRLKTKYNIIFLIQEQDSQYFKSLISNNILSIKNCSLLVNKNRSFESFFKIGNIVDFPTLLLYNAKDKSVKILSDLKNL